MFSDICKKLRADPELSKKKSTCDERSMKNTWNSDNVRFAAYRGKKNPPVTKVGVTRVVGIGRHRSRDYG